MVYNPGSRLEFLILTHLFYTYLYFWRFVLLITYERLELVIRVPPQATNQPEKRAPLLVAGPVHFDDDTFNPFDAIPNLSTFKHLEKMSFKTRFWITTQKLLKVPIKNKCQLSINIRNNCNGILGIDRFYYLDIKK